MKRINFVIFLVSIGVFLFPCQAYADDVLWTDLVGMSASGNTITKTASTDWGNGGAASVQVLAGDGYVEWEAVETNTTRICGLSTNNVDAHRDTVEFGAMAHETGVVNVYENGTLKGKIGTYQAGDKF
ncbi:MAG: hypothetical protein KAR32_05405, partial [Candidatus Omnitrophica bacterium]|nr:hypothetical protein [Candidatus Omnitrophota bacterium]